MKILLWGTYDCSKPRIRILREGLRANGVEILEIHTNIWEDVRDKSALRGAGKWLRRAMRVGAAYPRLVWRYLNAPSHDAVLVAYPGQFDVLVLRPFAWIRRKPIVFDWFISAYDTAVLDRHLFGPGNPVAWALWLGEWLAAHASNLAFMDTATHSRRMERLFHLGSGTLGHVWVGAESGFFPSDPRPPSPHDGFLHVLFYGQFIPLHGIETIVNAARITRHEPIRWTLIGTGQETDRIRGMLERDPLPNVVWIDWVSYDELPQRIGEANVCLGIFGTSDKAASVIPNKVFQTVAAGRPLVTRKSAAIRELLVDGAPCTRLIEAGDAASLAEAIRQQAHIMQTSGVGDCHAIARSRIHPRAIGSQLQTLIIRQFPKLDSKP